MAMSIRLVSGKNIKDYKRGELRTLFGMVLQDTWLFEGTIRENLKYNKESIGDDEVMEKCKVVGVDHFIKTLQGGLDAKIDNGESISLGQKQLLTIARGRFK